MDGARNTVRDLDVHLGESVGLIDRSFSQITDGSRFNHITDNETADSLVLGDTASAVQTAIGLNVATSLLSTTMISSLASLKVKIS